MHHFYCVTVTKKKIKIINYKQKLDHYNKEYSNLELKFNGILAQDSLVYKPTERSPSTM